MPPSVTDPTPCPLCAAPDTSPFTPGTYYPFRRCPVCALTFVPRAFHPPAPAARARYLEHRNAPDNPGYRAFLNRVAAPLAAKLPPGAAGLDFGSGPEPALAALLEARGFTVRLYDPFFAPDTDALARAYTFVVCTETVEHFAEPGREFARLDGLLRPGGWLAVMTQPLEDDAAFPGWWYHRDNTHLCFYRAATMRWIAARFAWRLETPTPSVSLYQKPF